MVHNYISYPMHCVFYVRVCFLGLYLYSTLHKYTQDSSLYIYNKLYNKNTRTQSRNADDYDDGNEIRREREQLTNSI